MPSGGEGDDGGDGGGDGKEADEGAEGRSSTVGSFGGLQRCGIVFRVGITSAPVRTMMRAMSRFRLVLS